MIQKVVDWNQVEPFRCDCGQRLGNGRYNTCSRCRRLQDQALADMQVKQRPAAEEHEDFDVDEWLAENS